VSIVEHGSSIEYEPSDATVLASRRRLDGAELTFFGTARQSLIALSRTLAETSCLKRVLLPDHYCHSTTRAVGAALATKGVAVELYAATFGTPVVLATECDDLVVVNAAFGVMPSVCVTGKGSRVLDATHAPDLALLPESGSSVVRFDYVFSSLKKLLPVTDGGVLRAIGSQILPPRPSTDPAHEEQARKLERLLHLKKRYVDGGDVDKANFYPAIKKLENLITQRSSPLAMSEVAKRQLTVINVAASVRAARRNVAHCSDRLKDTLRRTPSIKVLETETFVALLCTDAKTKQSLVDRLVCERIYPAALWPTDGLPGVSTPTRDFVARLIVLNADMRYSTEHMTSVTELLGAAVRSLEGRRSNR
jgi:hypothetical protein